MEFTLLNLQITILVLYVIGGLTCFILFEAARDPFDVRRWYQWIMIVIMCLIWPMTTTVVTMWGIIDWIRR